MQSTTSIETTTRDGKPISVRLGDMFVMGSEFAATNSDVDISNYIILSLLTVGILPAPPHLTRIYFSMIGMDKLRYSVSKKTENGLVILDRGKEIELDEEYLVRATKSLSNSKGSGIVGGLELYIRTIVTSPPKIKTMNMHKLATRLVDMSKWPKLSLRVWAIYHLGLSHVPSLNHIDSKTDMINSMIKLAVSARRSDGSKPKSHKAPFYGAATGRIQMQNYEAGRQPSNNRFGKISGVPFINLSRNEIEFPRGVGDCVEIHLLSDISRNDVHPYTIVCINHQPEWVLVGKNTIPQGQMMWNFYDGYRLVMPIKVFDSDLLSWLMEAHDVEEVGIEEAPVKYKADDVYAYNNSSNYAANSVNAGGGGIYRLAASGPVMAAGDPPVLSPCLWSDDVVVPEDHRIKQAYVDLGKFEEHIRKYRGLSDPGEEEI